MSFRASRDLTETLQVAPRRKALRFYSGFKKNDCCLQLGFGFGERMELMPRPSPTCAICLDLIANHLPTTRWQFHVTENRLVESWLHFKLSDLEISSRDCVLCFVVKEGLTALGREILWDTSGVREGNFILQNNSPLEVEILDPVEHDVRPLRFQFFIPEG